MDLFLKMFLMLFFSNLDHRGESITIRHLMAEGITIMLAQEDCHFCIRLAMEMVVTIWI